MRDELKLLQEAVEYGEVFHICHICGEECEGTEPDSCGAFCPDCDKVIDVEPVI